MKTYLKALGLVLLAPLAANAVTIYIDFGHSSTPTTLTGWNNFTSKTAQSNLALLDSTGAATSLTISYTTFTDPNQAGTLAPTGDAAERYPVTATQDNFYSHGVSNPSVTVTISGLSSSELYQFTYFASRLGGSETLETLYSLTNGTDVSAVALNANNTGTLVSSSYLAPSSSGTLTLTLSPGANNNHASKFYYLGVLEINSTPIPEPGAYAAFAGAAMLGFVLRRRRRAS